MPYFLFCFSLATYSSCLWPRLPGLLELSMIWACAAGGVLVVARQPLKKLISHAGSLRKVDTPDRTDDSGKGADPEKMAGFRVLSVCLIAIAVGVTCATLWGNDRLAGTLPATLDKTDYVLVGVVRGLPSRGERATRFLFDIESLQLPPGKGVAPAVPPRRVLLNWYGGETLVPGQRWQLTARLRSPRSFANPGGFDYRAWLLSRGIDATGYVRAGSPPGQMAPAPGYRLDRWRHEVGAAIDRITDVPGTGRRFLRALAIGDGRALSEADRERLRVTGLSHLMVVSGLHIGMIAGAGMLVGAGIGRALVAVGAVATHRSVAAIVSWLLALTYALLAGLSLPTQRALIMLSVFLLAVLMQRKTRPAVALIWALALQAVVDPLAALSPGFWLSYGAVAAFIWYFSPRPRRSTGLALLEAQLLIFVLLAGALGYFYGRIPLVSVVVNLLAIPWLSFLILPLALLGVFILPLSASAAEWCWHAAGTQLQWFQSLLTQAGEISRSWSWQLVTDQPLLLAVALTLAGGLLLAPRGLGLRGLGLLLLLAVLLMEVPPRSGLRVAVLDVGQGLAVVLEANDRTLVYDTGAKFSERFNAGEGIVAPYLRSRGIAVVDLLVVSHNDADHAGGARGLLNSIPVGRVMSGQAADLALEGVQPCRRGVAWQWQDVRFEILAPEHSITVSDNDASCVIAVSQADRTILLTGDITGKVERQLVRAGLLPPDVDLLVAPHHGSNSSSTAEFISAVTPKHVVYSAGYNHHFGHPHAKVVARYREVGAEQWSTADAGAIVFDWPTDEKLRVETARQGRSRYWRDAFLAPP